MKKIVFVMTLLCFISFYMLNTGNRHIAAKEEHDLLILASALQEEKINIHGWSLHAREKVDHFNHLDEVEEYYQVLKNKLSDWEWKVESDSNQWEATATKVSSGKHQERIQILSTTTTGSPQTYIIYEVKGENLNDKNVQFIKEELTGTLSDIFRGNATIFSCIKGEFNGKINKTLPNTVNELLQAFQAKEIEALKEDNFISTSAHSPLFADTIKSNENNMNLQIGIRTQGLGAKTTLVVGTPIITIEY